MPTPEEIAAAKAHLEELHEANQKALAEEQARERAKKALDGQQ